MEVQQVSLQPVQTKAVSNAPPEGSKAVQDFQDILGKMQRAEQAEAAEPEPEERQPKKKALEVQSVPEAGMLGIVPEIMPEADMSIPEEKPDNGITVSEEAVGNMAPVPGETAGKTAEMPELTGLKPQTFSVQPEPDISRDTSQPEATGNAEETRKTVLPEESGKAADNGKSFALNQEKPPESTGRTAFSEVRAEAGKEIITHEAVSAETPDKQAGDKADSSDSGGQQTRSRNSGKVSQEVPREQSKNTSSLEELQTKVDSGSYLNAERMARTALLSNIGIEKELQGTDSAAVLSQLRTGISQGIQKSMEEFTIRLKPEGLGEIVVHLAHAGGKILLSIGVSNEETQRMLNSEMMNLKELLRPMDAQVQEIYHNEAGSLDFGAYQQNQFRRQQQMMSGGNGRRLGFADIREEADELLMNIQPESSFDNGRLNTYI